ncbi:hypothetical protein [Lactococcus lactis]|uniref:hypothetical protein n=1 Tax=Lactococcus lactis TaxID=1358 RepID=UPI002890C75D|nr:hypothetical protein [Lactococcus lactis]MDT2886410.1 hypothetical protein [Lactococcus lactis]MDT2928825.1 hypothetical protein [Lactococcus lactis]MDT2939249.1 hypothetical protein [Lactococcus lactis]
MNFELKEFTNIPNCYHSFNVVNESQFESTCENLIKEMSFFFKRSSFEGLKILNPNPIEKIPQYFSSNNLIYLNVRDGIRESQIIYQLAHEMCHYFMSTGIKNDELKYFEETLCDLSSHFFLRNKPQKIHKVYDDEALMNITEIDLSSSTSYDRYNREQNTYIAKLLLPIFEKNPSLWSEVPKLANIEASTIGKLLDLWKNKATSEHKKAIQEIQNIFK